MEEGLFGLQMRLEVEAASWAVTDGAGGDVARSPIKECLICEELCGVVLLCVSIFANFALDFALEVFIKGMGHFAS